MEEARVVVIEDDEMHRELARQYLAKRKHSVVAEASTVPEAFVLVDRIAASEIEADVILLDGNLTPEAYDGEDARRIAERMSEARVTAKIIGFSLGSMEEYGVEVHADTFKDMHAVIQAIDEL